MFWHIFPVQILQELFHLLLLLVRLLIEVALERLEDFLVLFLRLGLVAAEFVLFFHFRPDRQLADEVLQEFVALMESCLQSRLRVDFLESVAVDVDQEAVSVGVLGHRKRREHHVHELGRVV